MMIFTLSSVCRRVSWKDRKIYARDVRRRHSMKNMELGEVCGEDSYNMRKHEI